MIRFARMFGRAWISLAVALILLGYGATWYLHGWSALSDILSPRNFWNYLVAVVTLLPGILALKWADKAETQKDRP